MRVIDNVKPAPRSELELHKQWLNNMASSLMPLRSNVRKIEIVEAYDCAECGQETTYYKFGGICGQCEALGERYD